MIQCAWEWMMAASYHNLAGLNRDLRRALEAGDWEQLESFYDSLLRIEAELDSEVAAGDDDADDTPDGNQDVVDSDVVEPREAGSRSAGRPAKGSAPQRSTSGSVDAVVHDVARHVGTAPEPGLVCVRVHPVGASRTGRARKVVNRG